MKRLRGNGVRGMATRIEHKYDETSWDQRVRGASWYDDAQQLARLLTLGGAYDVRQTAGVIATLSPMVRWEKNQDAAIAIVLAHARGERDPNAIRIGDTDEKPVGTKKNVRKSLAILSDATLEPTGPKVREFWYAILGDPDALTLDVHMLRAAVGERRRKYYQSMRENQPLRQNVVRAYRQAAASVGLPLRDFQSIIWVAERDRNETRK